MIRIVDFTSDKREYIKTLNYEWLELFFKVEPTDVQQLSNPEEEIIGKGGHIFYAELDGIIVGTASLLNKGDSVYELGKMATTESAKGNGVGNALLQHCIDFAKSKNARSIILYSNTKLQAAIHLYRKYGFHEIPLADSNYVRSNIKMKKNL